MLWTLYRVNWKGINDLYEILGMTGLLVSSENYTSGKWRGAEEDESYTDTLFSNLSHILVPIRTLKDTGHCNHSSCP